MRECSRDFGMSLEVLELRDDVGVDQSRVERAVIVGGRARRQIFPGRLNVSEPFGGQGQARQLAVIALLAARMRGIRGQDGLDGAAVGMATDNDVPHVQDLDRVLDRRRDAAGHRAVRRHNVAHSAAQEHIAGLGLENQVRYDARVGAGDEEHVGLLAIGEQAETVAVLREDVAAEAGVALKETLHRG